MHPGVDMNPGKQWAFIPFMPASHMVGYCGYICNFLLRLCCFVSEKSENERNRKKPRRV